MVCDSCCPAVSSASLSDRSAVGAVGGSLGREAQGEGAQCPIEPCRGGRSLSRVKLASWRFSPCRAYGAHVGILGVRVILGLTAQATACRRSAAMMLWTNSRSPLGNACYLVT